MHNIIVGKLWIDQVSQWKQSKVQSLGFGDTWTCAEFHFEPALPILYVRTEWNLPKFKWLSVWLLLKCFKEFFMILLLRWQSGEIDVVNHTTGDRCHLKFAPYSYFSRDVARKVRRTKKPPSDSVLLGPNSFLKIVVTDSSSLPSHHNALPPQSMEFLLNPPPPHTVVRWQVWWWTRMARPTMCYQARGMRRWSFHGWCRAAEVVRTAPRVNRKLFIKRSKPERCGGETHSRKYCDNLARCVKTWLTLHK